MVQVEYSVPSAIHIEETDVLYVMWKKYLKKMEAALDSTYKRIVHLEAKLVDLENSGRRQNLKAGRWHSQWGQDNILTAETGSDRFNPVTQSFVDVPSAESITRRSELSQNTLVCAGSLLFKYCRSASLKTSKSSAFLLGKC